MMKVFILFLMVVGLAGCATQHPDQGAPSTETGTLSGGTTGEAAPGNSSEPTATPYPTGTNFNW